METQTGREIGSRWRLCVAPPAELIHLSFIFFSAYLSFRIAVTFSPTVLSDTEPRFSFPYCLSIIHLFFLSPCIELF